MFPASMVQQMRARLQAVADGLGVPIHHQDHAPSTRKALAISELARSQELLVPWREAAMGAYWRDGRDLEDPDVLRELATTAGLDGDEALAFLQRPEVPRLLSWQREQAQAWGVTGIPTWFLLPTGWSPGDPVASEGPRPVKVVGCQPLDVVLQAASRAGATPRS